MLTDAADDLVPFSDVRVIRSTAAALFCRIGGKRVWLPRALVSGMLWHTGDRGRLFVRRSAVDDHGLRDEPIVAVR